VESVLVVDWPSRDMPESFARAGLRVVVKGGPGPTDYAEWVLEEDVVSRRPLGRAPERVDAVYAYRPVAELAGIVQQAKALGAREVWREPGSDEAEARGIVEAAGLRYVDAGEAVSRPGRR
jgi:predicted CoA-binding protein